MKLKLDDKGAAVLQDGKPVYVHDDGKEVAFDAAATLATISRLNGEAKGHRERAEAAEGKLKAFDGIEDAAAARKALQTVKNLDDKKLVDAGEVEKVKAEVKASMEAHYKPQLEKAAALERELYAEKIGGSFARSKFIAEKVAVPADVVQALFRDRFQLEGGKVVATDASGNRIYSSSKPGELADFDEAVSTLLEQYPHKASLLKSSGASGGGAGPSNPQGGAKTMSRAQFDAASHADRASFAKAGGSVID